MFKKGSLTVRKTPASRILLVGFAAALIAALSGILLPQKAYAAGESYNWSGTSINGTRGSFSTFQGGNVRFYKNTDKPNTYTGMGLIVSCGSSASPRYTITLTGPNNGTIATTIHPGCPDAPNVTGNINTIIGTAPAGAYNPNPADPNGPRAAEEDKLCDRPDSLMELNYWICPFINTAADMTEKLDSAILELIYIDLEPIFNPENKAPSSNEAKSSAAFFTAWSAFRNIAYALLIIVGLIMVVSQVLGFDWVDAYTIRKMLPKLLLAVFFIAISWRAAEFVLTAANAAGAAGEAIIKAPFANIDAGIGTGPDNVTMGAIAAAFMLVGVGIGAAVLALGGWGVIGSLIATGGLIVLQAWFLLTARNGAAPLLAIMWPVFIVFWLWGPFKKVFDLAKALSVTIAGSIPLIAMWLAITKVGALITYATGQAAGAIVAFTLLLVGYTFLFVILKKVDMLYGMMGNVVSQTTGKLQKQLADYRGDRVKQNWGRYQMGDRFHGKYTSALNDSGFAVGAFMRQQNKGQYLNPLNYMGKKRRGRTLGTIGRDVETQRRLAGARAAGTDESKITQYDDYQQRAQMFRSEEDARQRMGAIFNMGAQDVESAIAAAKANGGWSAGNRIKAFEYAAASGTAFNTWRDSLTMLNDIAGDDDNIRNQLSAKLKQNSVAAGRTDFGAGISDIIAAANDVRENGQNSHYLDGQWLTMKALRSQDATSYMRGKPVSVEIGGRALATEMETQERAFQTATTEEAREKARRELVILNNLASDMKMGTAYSSSDNKVALSTEALEPIQSPTEGRGGRPDRAPLSDRVTQITTNHTIQSVPDTSRPLYDDNGNIVAGQFAQRQVAVPNPAPRQPNPVTGEFGYDQEAARLNENIQNPYARQPTDMNNPNNPHRPGGQ